MLIPSIIQINHVELVVFKTFDPPLRKREEEGRGGREVATTEIYWMSAGIFTLHIKFGETIYSYLNSFFQNLIDISLNKHCMLKRFLKDSWKTTKATLV